MMMRVCEIDALLEAGDIIRFINSRMICCLGHVLIMDRYVELQTVGEVSFSRSGLDQDCSVSDDEDDDLFTVA